MTMFDCQTRGGLCLLAPTFGSYSAVSYLRAKWGWVQEFVQFVQ
jgi:hypothetical protein